MNSYSGPHGSILAACYSIKRPSEGVVHCDTFLCNFTCLRSLFDIYKHKKTNCLFIVAQ